jgi:hypothetical protein
MAAFIISAIQPEYGITNLEKYGGKTIILMRIGLIN